MGFKAAQIEKLNYDFRPTRDVSGTIPEPSSAQVEAFREAMGDAMKIASDLDPATWGGEGTELTQQVMVDRIDAVLGKSKDVEKAVTDAVLELVKAESNLTPEFIEGLPYRVRAAFVGWIVGEFFNPEG